jgi:signal transduction histidine kinase
MPPHAEELFFRAFSAIGLPVIIILGLLSILRLRRIEQLTRTTAYLRKSLEEMDEQAKLIVRTDLELNKTQEELDKKINGLFALQRLSQSISKTLIQDEIFKRLSIEHIQEIGFQKALVFSENKSGGFSLCHRIGFDEESAQNIEREFSASDTLEMVKEINSTFSSLSQNPVIREIIPLISNITGITSVVVSPIIKKEGFFGCILVGNTFLNETKITEGDEELVAILATQIGQALENAELFEALYSQHQALERQVEARTKELSNTLNELKLVNKRKSDFVSTVSHELRTPLTSIKGYASILLSDKLGALPHEAKERLTKINTHSDELTHLVNDLLDITRIESDRFEMRPVPIDIRHTVDSVLDLLNPQLKEKAINVELNLPQGLSYASADKTQIPRVFINLIGNAIKFVPRDSGSIKISAFESAGDLLQINIADNGIGMSETDAKRIFEEFYRVDNPINQKVKGTGLGLTLVKNIIQAHGGRIWVISKLNHGSIFSFTLPKANGEPK